MIAKRIHVLALLDQLPADAAIAAKVRANIIGSQLLVRANVAGREHDTDGTGTRVNPR